MALVVNGELVSDQMIAEQYEMLARAYPAVSGGASAGAVDGVLQQQLWRVAEENAIFRAILSQQANASDLVVSAKEIAAEVATRRGHGQSSLVSAGEGEMIAREMKEERFIERLTRTVPKATTRELEAIYQQAPGRFQQPEQVHVRHIIKNVNEFTSQAEAGLAIGVAQAALRTGRRFERVADEFSDSRGNGGDLGWISRNEMVPEFEEVVFKMLPGQVSEVFASRFGLHIALLVARRAQRVLPFAEVRGHLAQEAVEVRRQNALVVYLRQEAQRADIRVVREPAVSRP